MAIAIVFGGSNFSSTLAMGSHSMTVAPLTMQMDMGARQKAPGKTSPCGRMDCGCCIGGFCAAPVAVLGSPGMGPTPFAGRTGPHNRVILTGITFPPDIRPPISHAILA